MKKNNIEITQTGRAITVENKTIGTTYVKIPIKMKGINCFIVIPGNVIINPGKLCQTLNNEFSEVVEE